MKHRDISDVYCENLRKNYLHREANMQAELSNVGQMADMVTVLQ